jgi:hypothetical protein
MIAIRNVLISNEVADEQFVCDLNKCKGGCCVDGDAGAPLDSKELKEVNEAHEAVLPYLSDESKIELLRQGNYVYDKEFGWVTPTINSSICVYGIIDNNGIVKCSFEQAYNDGKTKWKKPISCHLYPIRVKKTRDGKTDLVNYEPREELCKAACTLGKRLKVPVYIFLKDALIRKFGEDFYDALCATVEHQQSVKSGPIFKNLQTR